MGFCKGFLPGYSKQEKQKLSSTPARIKINIDFLETSSLLNQLLQSVEMQLCNTQETILMNLTFKQ